MDVRYDNTLGVTIGLRDLSDADVGGTGYAVVVSLGTGIGFVLRDREIAAQMADLFLEARDQLDDMAQAQLDEAFDARG